MVTMDKVGDSSNSEYKITLNPKFHWFLEDEFKELREEFKPTDYKSDLNKRKSAVRKNTPVQEDEKQQDQQQTGENINKKTLIF